MAKANIGIVGAGQSGLLLGVGLLKSGFDVTVYSDRTPEEQRNGRVSSTQWISPINRDIERELGLNFWEDTLPPIDGFRFRLVTPDGHVFETEGDLPRPGESVDQRVKFARWMEHFEAIGGNLVIRRIEKKDFHDLGEAHDFVVVATGKGDLGQIFDRIPEHSPYDEPMREIALLQFRGCDPEHVDPDRVCFTVLAGLGEVFPMPVETTTDGDLAWTYVHESIPGSPIDVFGDVDWRENPEEMLEKLRQVWKEHMPFFARGIKEDKFRLTDDNAVLQGAFPPHVKEPVATLPNGTVAMALGDACVLNDPVTGQGSNNATRHAWTAYQMIKDHDGPWDEEFAQSVFERHWEYAQYVVNWTNAMLKPGPPPDHVVKIFSTERKEVGDMLAHAVMYPPNLFPWFADPEEADKALADPPGYMEEHFVKVPETNPEPYVSDTVSPPG